MPTQKTPGFPPSLGRLRPGLPAGRPGLWSAGVRPGRRVHAIRRSPTGRLRRRRRLRRDLRRSGRRRIRRIRAGRLRRRGNIGHPAARRRKWADVSASRRFQHRRSRPGRPIPVARHRRVPPPPRDPLGWTGRAAVRPQLHERHHRQQCAGTGMAVGRWRRDSVGPLGDHRPDPLNPKGSPLPCFAPRRPPSKYRDVADVLGVTSASDAAPGRKGRQMQGLVLQLTRAGFLMLLWVFIWSVLRILRTDIYAPTGAVMVRRGLALRGTLLPSRQRRHAARYLVITEGSLAGARITLSGQPVLIGRADDSTLVLTDDYASTRHARLSQRGSEWYVEDLGSTNGTYLDRAKVTTAVRVPIGTPVRIGKTAIELRP